MNANLEAFVRYLVTIVETKYIHTEVADHNQMDWVKTSLSKVGVTELDGYDLKDLHMLWRSTYFNSETDSYDAIYSPSPNYDCFIAWYIRLLQGFVQFQVIRFKATRCGFIWLNDENIVVEACRIFDDEHNNDVLIKALLSIAMADPFLKNFIKLINIDSEECIIEFNFTEVERREIRNLYYDLFPDKFDWLAID